MLWALQRYVLHGEDHFTFEQGSSIRPDWWGRHFWTSVEGVGDWAGGSWAYSPKEFPGDLIL